MRFRRSTDSSVRGVTWSVHSWSGNGTAEPSGAGATFPSGGTGTSLFADISAGGSTGSSAGDAVATEVLGVRSLIGYFGPTVATAL